MAQKSIPSTVLAYITNTTLVFRQYWILLGLYMVDFSYALSKPTQKWHVSGIYDEATKPERNYDLYPFPHDTNLILGSFDVHKSFFLLSKDLQVMIKLQGGRLETGQLTLAAQIHHQPLRSFPAF